MRLFTLILAENLADLPLKGLNPSASPSKDRSHVSLEEVASQLESNRLDNFDVIKYLKYLTIGLKVAIKVAYRGRYKNELTLEVGELLN